jgi:hypothetical protein
MAARRTGWKSTLSEATRDRYTRAAESGRLTGSPVPANRARSVAYRYWSSGGDLRAARGHTPKPQTPEPVAAAAGRMLSGRSEAGDSATLRVWREALAPDWLPPSRGFLADDAAAILAQAPRPDVWGQVTFQPHSDGTWGMFIERRDSGYPVQLELPDRASALAVMNLHRGLGPGVDWDGWEYWAEWADDYDFDVADTDVVA